MRIAILDSFSSVAFTRIKGEKFRTPFVPDSSFNMKGDAFMTSSSINKASQESDAIRGSFFTYYLVAGLRGAVDMILYGHITLIVGVPVPTINTGLDEPVFNRLT